VGFQNSNYHDSKWLKDKSKRNGFEFEIMENLKIYKFELAGTNCINTIMEPRLRLRQKVTYVYRLTAKTYHICECIS